jgi:hypothetical protein
MTTVETIKRVALASAAVATNVAEVLIKNGLTTRQQVRNICQEHGVIYSHGMALSDEVLVHLAIEAGVGLRNVRLSIQNDQVPIVTTSESYLHPLTAFTDGHWGTVEIRSRQGNRLVFPITESHRDTISSSLSSEIFSTGLSAHYAGFMAFLTLDGRAVFVNRSMIGRLKLHHLDRDHGPVGWQYLTSLAKLRWLADGFATLSQTMSAPLASLLLSRSGAVVDEAGRVVIDDGAKVNFPPEVVNITYGTGETEAIDIVEFSVDGFERAMSFDGEFLILQEHDGETALPKKDIWAIEIPIIHFSDYADALESRHYQSLTAAFDPFV